MATLKIKTGYGTKKIGDDQPVFIVAEIGINHNGNLETATEMIAEASLAGASAVKFQKRTPEVCVPKDQWGIMRDTPWGYIEYIKYRKLIEFEKDEYDVISQVCHDWNIPWFASVWDAASIDFMEQYQPFAYKVPSAMLTNGSLLEALLLTGRPLIVSTGMSTKEEILECVPMHKHVAVLHCTSTYPCPPKQVNLNMITTLKEWFPQQVIGYSGHETGLVPSVAAVALGAKIIERHFTLDRAMWGTDQAGSVEPKGFERLVDYIRVIEKAMGTGKKIVYQEEKIARTKLRGDV